MLHKKRLMGYIAAAFSVLTLAITQVSVAETQTVKPSGEFAQIDTRLANDTIQSLLKETPDKKQAVIAKIKANPENYAPPVFYVLSNVLFEKGEKDEAAFWFYAGQLRARVDANICADISARQAVGVLNQNYGTPINQYTFQNIPKLELLVPKVIDWERKTSYNYDRRWINLHGMGAMISGLDEQNSQQAALSYPEEQWDAIAEKTRVDYLSGFKKAMLQMKNNN